MDVFYSWQEDSLKLLGLELDKSAGIGPAARDAHVTPQVSHNGSQCRVTQWLARIETMGDVDVPGFDLIAHECGGSACHVRT